jgi:hypothetical protein
VLGDAPTGEPTRGRAATPHDRVLGDAPTSASGRGRATAPGHGGGSGGHTLPGAPDRGHVVETGHGRALGITLTGSGAGRVDSEHGRGSRVTLTGSSGRGHVDSRHGCDSGLGFTGEGERGHAFDSGHGRGDRITLAGEGIPSTATTGRGHVDSAHGRGNGITYTGGSLPLVAARSRGRACSTHGGDVGATPRGGSSAPRVAVNVHLTHDRAGAAAPGGDPGRDRARTTRTRTAEGQVGVAPTLDPGCALVAREHEHEGETESPRGW